MQLHPREQFTIVRQLQNPYITDTFYVRAVIRNAKTDVIIDTIDLTDRTDQRFSKNWSVPADPSGQGFWVSIVTSVYTDSGYTTKSENYGDEENTYLIQERYVFNPNYPVGGGSDISYKRIKKMLDDAVAEILSKNEPKVVEVVKTVVKEVKVPDVRIVEKMQEPDLSPVLDAVRLIGEKVDKKPVTVVPPHEKIDLGPVLTGIDTLTKNADKHTEELKQKIDSVEVKVEFSNPIVVTKMHGVKSPIAEDSRITKLMKKQ